jgi:hypothetical protein
MRGVGDALHIGVYVLAGIAAIEAGAIAVLSAFLVRGRREIDELRHRTDTRNWLLSGGREAVKTAPLCVKSAVCLPGCRVVGGGSGK